MSSITRRNATVDGHEVAIEFDQTLRVINRVRLQVDGTEVDRGNVFYGDKSLRTTLADGTDVEILVHSGMVGELTRAQVRRGEGSWTDLV